MSKHQWGMFPMHEAFTLTRDGNIPNKNLICVSIMMILSVNHADC